MLLSFPPKLGANPTEAPRVFVSPCWPPWLASLAGNGVDLGSLKPTGEGSSVLGVCRAHEPAPCRLYWTRWVHRQGAGAPGSEDSIRGRGKKNDLTGLGSGS